MFLRISLLMVALAPCLFGYKVLLFVPGMSNSQTLYFARIGELLAQHGHEVTSFKAIYDPRANKTVAVGVKEINVKTSDSSDEFLKFQLKFQGSAFTTENNFDPYAMFEFKKFMQEGCEYQILQKELLEQLKAEKFDIALVNMYEFCPFGMVKLLEIPTYIWVSSTVMIEHMASLTGAPTFPSYNPNVMSAKSDHMDFWERLVNFGAFLLSVNLFPIITSNPQTEVFRKHYGQDFPHLTDLAVQSPLVFINSEELLDFPRPILHKTIYTGGIGMKEAKPLTKVSI